MASLKDAVSREVVQQLCADHAVSLVLNTTAFAAGAIDDPAPFELAGDAPVLQVILSGGNREDWEKDNHGLNSRDVAMHVALPEVDGRIITARGQLQGPRVSLRAYRRSMSCATGPTTSACASSPN